MSCVQKTGYVYVCLCASIKVLSEIPCHVSESGPKIYKPSQKRKPKTENWSSAPQKPKSIENRCEINTSANANVNKYAGKSRKNIYTQRKKLTKVLESFFWNLFEVLKCISLHCFIWKYFFENAYIHLQFVFNTFWALFFPSAWWVFLAWLRKQKTLDDVL